MLSGKILKKDRLGKVISKTGFEPKLHKIALDFYYGDVSTTLPGKRTATKIKRGKPHIQKRVLNDYLSNLHRKFFYI